MKNILVLVVIGIIVVFGLLWLKNQAEKPTPMEEQNENAEQKNDAQTNAAGVENGPYATKTEEATYFNETKGFYAEPENVGDYPGVVMIHEWWGLNDTIKSMAESLASQGYRVLAVDLYEGKVAQNTEEAKTLTSSVNKMQALQNMKAATKYLRDKESPKVAVLGWCFGGGKALELALSGEPLEATVIYYGTPLETDQGKLAKIKSPVLGIFGDKDQAIPTEKAQAFETSLENINKKNSVKIYKGVGHAFANPSGTNYAKKETEDAWEKTLDFLGDNLGLE